MDKDGPSSNDWCPIKKEFDTDTGRRPCKHRGRDWSDANGRNKRDFQPAPAARKIKGRLLGASERVQLC